MPGLYTLCKGGDVAAHLVQQADADLRVAGASVVAIVIIMAVLYFSAMVQ